MIQVPSHWHRLEHKHRQRWLKGSSALALVEPRKRSVRPKSWVAKRGPVAVWSGPWVPRPNPSRQFLTLHSGKTGMQANIFLLWTSKYSLAWIHKPKYYDYKTNKVILSVHLMRIQNCKTSNKLLCYYLFFFLENLWKKQWVHLWRRVCEQHLLHSCGTKALSTTPWLVRPSSNSTPLFPSKELWWLLDTLIGCWIELIWIFINYPWIKLSLVLEMTCVKTYFTM